MKFKLVLVFCILGFTPFINAMIAPVQRSFDISDMPLIDAQVLILISDNRSNEIHKMLKNGTLNPDTIIRGESILHWAIVYNDLHIVKKLIEYGAQARESDISLAKAEGFHRIAKALEEAKETQEIR